jgi:hypothetical protein
MFISTLRSLAHHVEMGAHLDFAGLLSNFPKPSEDPSDAAMAGF